MFGYEKRTECCVCGGAVTRPIVDLGEQRVNCFPKTMDELVSRPLVPLQLVMCRECSFVQLHYVVNPELMFREFYYRSGITQTMRDELAWVASRTQTAVHMAEGDAVLDIGANDGTLLRAFPSNVRKVAVEPAKNIPLEGDGIQVVREFYGEQGVPGEAPGSFKVITAVAMFYDLTDPNAFLRGIAHDLHEDGVLFVQMNRLAEMCAGKELDNISHEHVGYYSLKVMVGLLKRNGLHVVQAGKRAINGGSFYVMAKKKPVNWPWDLTPEREKPKTTQGKLRVFQNSIGEVRKTILEVLKGYKTVGVCGASSRGNTLLQYLRLGPNEVACAFERDERKWGRMTTTGIPIVPEMEDRKVAIKLVLPWHFKKELTEREAVYLKSGGTLLFPLPNPVLVTKNGEVRL